MCQGWNAGADPRSCFGLSCPGLPCQCLAPVEPQATEAGARLGPDTQRLAPPVSCKNAPRWIRSQIGGNSMHVPRGPRLGTQVRINRLLWFEMPRCCSSVLLVPKTWGSDAHQQGSPGLSPGPCRQPAGLAQPLGIPSGRHWKWALALLPGPPSPPLGPSWLPMAPPKETPETQQSQTRNILQQPLGPPRGQGEARARCWMPPSALLVRARRANLNQSVSCCVALLVASFRLGRPETAMCFSLGLAVCCWPRIPQTLTNFPSFTQASAIAPRSTGSFSLFFHLLCAAPC